MSLGNLGLETLFLMLAGFLLGAVPAFILIGIYFGRRIEKERKELQLRYERQMTALRETVRRFMDRIDTITGENEELRRDNQALREAVRDQHSITDAASSELDSAKQSIQQLQVHVNALNSANLRYEGRLEQAALHQQQMEDQFQRTVEHFTQTKRLQDNLVFAASQLRETQVANQALENGLRSRTQLVSEEELTPAEQLDVGIIGGLEPQYAERLHESGIHTIGDLAQQTPARVAHFAGLPTWDDSAAWIAEAKIRVASAASV